MSLRGIYDGGGVRKQNGHYQSSLIKSEDYDYEVTAEVSSSYLNRVSGFATIARFQYYPSVEHLESDYDNSIYYNYIVPNLSGTDSGYVKEISVAFSDDIISENLMNCFTGRYGTTRGYTTNTAVSGICCTYNENVVWLYDPLIVESDSVSSPYSSGGGVVLDASCTYTYTISGSSISKTLSEINYCGTQFNADSLTWKFYQYSDGSLIDTGVAATITYTSNSYKIVFSEPLYFNTSLSELPFILYSIGSEQSVTATITAKGYTEI